MEQQRVDSQIRLLLHKQKQELSLQKDPVKKYYDATRMHVVGH